MTNKEMEKRFSDIEGILLKLMEGIEERPQKNFAAVSKLPSAVLHWIKPYVIPFILGVIVGIFSAAVFTPQTPIEQQAALGGAVIPPFSNWIQPNGSPSPGPLYSPPRDSTVGWRDSSLTNISEPPLPANRQADNGQATSTKLFKRLVRPMP